jgi:hypothetical protein
MTAMNLRFAFEKETKGAVRFQEGWHPKRASWIKQSPPHRKTGQNPLRKVFCI